MAWIELHQTLPGHRKTMRLRRILKIGTAQAVGHLCMLWLWALDNCQDGDVSGLLDCEIAEAAGYDGKKPEEFAGALRAAGFVDCEGRIHDWDAYAGRLMDRREQTKEQTRKRVERYRARQKPTTETECNALHSVTGNGVETLGNAPTVPNPTVPNSTVQYSTKEPSSYALDTDAADALPAYFSSNLKHMSAGNYDELRQFLADGVSDDLARFAVDTATAAGRQTWSFTRYLLDQWIAADVKTIGDAKAFEQKRIAGKVAPAAQGGPPIRFVDYEGGDGT